MVTPLQEARESRPTSKSLSVQICPWGVGIPWGRSAARDPKPSPVPAPGLLPKDVGVRGGCPPGRRSDWRGPHWLPRSEGCTVRQGDLAGSRGHWAGTRGGRAEDSVSFRGW